MHNGTYSNKPVPHIYFVAKTTDELPNNAVFNAAGTRFQNGTNAPITVNTVAYQPSQIMLANGQVQFYNGQTQLAVAAATNPLQMESFFIAQGRSTIGDSISLMGRPVEKSELIPTRANIKVRARACAVDSNDAWVIGVPNTTVGGNINVVDNYSYGLTVAFHGHIAYKLNARNNPAFFPNFSVEGTWTELGIATVANQRDYIVQNLVYNINRHSQLWGQLETEPVVALAIKANAGAGVQLSTILPGQTITVAVKNGNVALPVNLVITNGIYNAIQNAITSGQVLATDRIVVANTTTAGNGTHAAAQILLIALDRPTVDVDRMISVKYRIENGLSEGFGPTVNNVRVSTPFEGFGLPRHVQLDYEKYAELNKKYRVQYPSGDAFQYPTDVVPYRAYTLIDIEYQVPSEASTGHVSPETQLITIAVPCCDEAALTAWQAFLNGFVAAMPNSIFEGPLATNAKTFNFGYTLPCDSDLLAPFNEIIGA